MEEDGFINFSQVLKPAIYALVYKGKPIYIGKTTVPAARIANHKSMKHTHFIATPFGNKSVEKISFDEVYLLPCSEGDLDKLEREYINKYKPKYNIKHKGNTYIPGSMEELVKKLVTTNANESVTVIRRRA